MCVCVYTYIYIYICMHTHIHMHLHRCIHACVTSMTIIESPWAPCKAPESLLLLNSCYRAPNI